MVEDNQKTPITAIPNKYEGSSQFLKYDELKDGTQFVIVDIYAKEPYHAEKIKEERELTFDDMDLVATCEEVTKKEMYDIKLNQYTIENLKPTSENPSEWVGNRVFLTNFKNSSNPQMSTVILTVIETE